MFSKVFSGGICGIDGYLVQVEADVSNGLPGFSMVGYLAAEVKEAQDRVKTALRNSDCQLPAKKVTVNLSPANRRKDGTGYDLAIAVAVLASYGIVAEYYLSRAAFIGEVGLNGEIKPIHGILSLVEAFRQAGMLFCFLPAANVEEAMAISGITIIGIESIVQIVKILNHKECLPESKFQYSDTIFPKKTYPDFSEVNGQHLLKRAAEIAAAGKHNLLIIGPAGSGKSMLAKRIPTIMPALSKKEQLEVSKIYSICGYLCDGSGLIQERPFRSPHHTISAQALAGGGRIPRPGEISLASGGVLFLDELPEFRKSVLEVLRQPLEDRQVVISRLQGSYKFPANTMLVAAMNPCPCSFYPDRNRCRCTENQVKTYLQHVSKPILDRMDLCVEASPLTFEEIQQKGRCESSDTVRKRVEHAREVQTKRFLGQPIYFNSEMQKTHIEEHCILTEADNRFLKQVFETKGISARVYHKILKVARTIADLEGEAQIKRIHLSEAVAYRQIEQKFWGGAYDG